MFAKAASKGLKAASYLCGVISLCRGGKVPQKSIEIFKSSFVVKSSALKTRRNLQEYLIKSVEELSRRRREAELKSSWLSLASPEPEYNQLLLLESPVRIVYRNRELTGLEHVLSG